MEVSLQSGKRVKVHVDLDAMPMPAGTETSRVPPATAAERAEPPLAASPLPPDGVPYRFRMPFPERAKCGVYTPDTTSVDRLVGELARKGSQAQGGGGVLESSRTTVTEDQLVSVLAKVQALQARLAR
jgi:hypothetical protein